jgi:hypothetical protein
MKGLKILVVIAALAVIAGTVSDTWAACGPGRVFCSQGVNAGTNNVRFSTAGTLNDTPALNQHCMMWDSDNASNSNNFDGSCPCTSWWLQRGTSTDKIVNGFQGGPNCLAVGCPADNLTVVVEDYQEGAPPGMDAGSTAYFMGMKVNETPTSARWWDYGLVDGATATTTLPMLPFPDVVITGSSRSPGAVNVSYTNLDVAPNIHTWDPTSGAVYPVADVVSEWQLLKATGLVDPGRDRANGWTVINTTEYVPGDQPASWSVPCTDTVQDEFLAIGIGFNGGSAGIIDSKLVGKAVALECNPNLAKPDNGTLEAKDPENIGTKPRRTGGRR